MADRNEAAEAGRVVAEAGRVLSENERSRAEGILARGRIQAEDRRETAEDARVLAEKDRVITSDEVADRLKAILEDAKKERVEQEHEKDAAQKKFSHKVVAAVAGILLLVGTLGGFALEQAHIINHLKDSDHTACVQRAAGREATKQTFDDIFDLISKVPDHNRTPDQQKAIDQFIKDSKATVDKRLPLIVCDP